MTVVSLVAASCSATDDPLGNEVEGTIDSESAEPSVDVQTGSELVDQRDSAEEEPMAALPSIWVRGDDAALRPSSPLAELGEVLAPAGDRGWTIVGSIFDYDTGINQPTIWSADEPGSRSSWRRTTLRQLDGGSAKMTAAVRAEEFDVAVGSTGQEQVLRPAVWVRPVGDEWRSVDRSQFDGFGPAWLSHVVVNRPNGLLLAIGGQTDADGANMPTLWVSADGEDWEAVEQLPFSLDGSEDLHDLTAGSTSTVLTGDRRIGRGRTAIAYWTADGRTWSEAEVEQPADGGDSYMGEAVWFRDRLVAVGGVATDGVYRPASWTSTDGKTWVLQQPPFELSANDRLSSTGFGAMRVTATDSRLYATSQSSFLQHLWQSTDGIDWTVIGDITEYRDQGFQVNSMAAVDDQVLLATGEPAIVIHDGGYSDALARSDLLPVPNEIPWVTDITHDGDEFVAVGGSSVRFGDGGTSESARLWRSPDGRDWETVERFPERSTGAVTAVAPLSDGLVAVGTESLRSAGAKRRPGWGLIWKSSLSRWFEVDAPSAIDDSARIGLEVVTAAGDDMLAGGWSFGLADGSDVDALLIQSNADAAPERVDLGREGSDAEEVVALCGNESGEAVALVAVQRPDSNEVAALRRSPDREWVDVDWPPPPQGVDAYVSDCAYGVDGFLAAGFTISGTDYDVGLWRTTDGSIWEPVDGSPSLSASGNQWVNSIAVTESGYLLAGNDASSGVAKPVVWYGSGDDWQQAVIVEAGTMSGLQIAYANGTVVVTGWHDGAEQVYSTSLDQLVAEPGE